MPTSKKSRAPAKRKAKAKTSRPVFASIALVVSDRKKAVEWYTEKLGLDLTTSEDHWITVGRKGHEGEIHLSRNLDYDPKGELEPREFWRHAPARRGFWTSCAALKSNGVTFFVGPVKESWGWYAGVRDPDGNELWLAPEA